MPELNYLHLQYFYWVARTGSVAAASEHLLVGMSTISTQVKKLEAQLGGALFRRAGRNLELTELGRHVFHYAEDIFELGHDLMASIEGGAPGLALRCRVGIANVVPKLIAYRLLEPALTLPGFSGLECREDEPARLLAELALHKLDLVISDAPIPPQVDVRAYNHRLGSSQVAIYATRDLCQRLQPSFPHCLHQMPFMLPTAGNALDRDLSAWFDRVGVQPKVLARFANSALLKVFGAAGHGCFGAPLAVRTHLEQQYQVEVLGLAEGVKERYYAISVERRLQHPAVLAIVEAAGMALDSDF
ncbi:MAG: LysR family transcriptional regulator [Planctomycetota bacterium]